MTRRPKQPLAAVFGAFSCRLLSAAIRKSQYIDELKPFPLRVQRAGTLAVACGLYLALTAMPAHAQTCAPQPSGLVAWWSLNETGGTAVADQSPLGQNPGTASSSIGSSSSSNPKSVTGFVGKGLNFYFGKNVSVSSSPSHSLDFGTGKSFTIDAWIKGHASPIVSNYDTISKTGYSLVFDGAKLRLEMSGTIPSTIWYGPAITPGVWTFVAAVVDRTTKQVSLYAGSGVSLAGGLVPPSIPNPADAGNNLPLRIGGCPGNPNGCDMIIDEVEIFNRPLVQSEIQDIFKAGSTGKCVPKGMTWQVGSVNATTGTVTVGCGSAPPNRCDPYVGDRPCTDSLPLLCFKPFNPILPVPMYVDDTDFYNRWSGGIIGTTAPVKASSFGGSLGQANAQCVKEFKSPDWVVAEFHNGANGQGGWNFQAYGNVGKPASRFWVHINDQPKGTCFPNP
jgi:Concanavalin A-like lectin/glucanases superfamily